uniref:NADH-ubiquinone oxidoreductase chain 4L n=1 Tax=Sagaminopteron nigropunctatum TaxID=1874340 RepID=E6Y1E2_9GAST|nr:NADH dehydrogenase subunit 4L [Sagaminopteron nigropunctatum]
MKLSLLGIMFSLCAFIAYQVHSLSLLISLEALMLSMLMFIFSFLCSYSDPYWMLVLLTMAACEAALGLSLLVSLLRVRGNDLSSLMSNNMY